MAYDDIERSEYLGSETFFYVFIGPNFEYRWTNAPKSLDADIDGTTYTFKHPRGGITHVSATESQNAGATSRDIKVSHRNPIIRRHREFPPPGDTEVTIYRQNEINGDVYEWWSGVVIETPIDGSKGVIHCKHVIELVSGSEGLTETQGPTCDYTHTIAPCPVPFNSINDTDLTVDDIDTDNLTVTVTGSIRIAGKYKLGIITAPNTDARTVLNDVIVSGKHVLTLTQNFPASTLKVGDVVSVSRGCNVLPQTCRDEFGEWTGNGVAHSATNIHANKNLHQIGRLE